MKKCVCGHEMTRHDWKNQWVCHRCGRTKHIEETLTNGDRFRAMGDEELAKFLSALCKAAKDCEKCPLYGNCPESEATAAWSDWLQQSSAEGIWWYAL